MENEKTLTLASFIDIYKNNIDALSAFKDVQKYFDASLGGCLCSRKSRQDYANYKFIQIISSSPIEELNKVKTILNSQKIKFQDMTGDIFKEI